MPVPKHLDDAVGKLKDATARVERCQAQPTSPALLRDWIEALTDFCFALADVHTFSNESVHEKLHELAERARVATVAPASRPQR